MASVIFSLLMLGLIKAVLALGQHRPVGFSRDKISGLQQKYFGDSRIAGNEIFEEHLKYREEKGKEVRRQGLDKFRERCVQWILDGKIGVLNKYASYSWAKRVSFRPWEVQ